MQLFFSNIALGKIFIIGDVFKLKMLASTAAPPQAQQDCGCVAVAGVRAQAKLLLSRLEVIGPVTGVAAAAGRRSLALNLERKVANQKRADLLSRLQGKALLRRGHFKID